MSSYDSKALRQKSKSTGQQVQGASSILLDRMLAMLDEREREREREREKFIDNQ